jgi:plasmid stability protein
MRRTLIQLDEDTHHRLRQRAFKERRSIAAVVRELVTAGLDSEAARRRPTRLQDMESIRAGRSKPGRLAPVSERHDEALADAFKK